MESGKTSIYQMRYYQHRFHSTCSTTTCIKKNYNEGHWSVTRPSIVNSNKIFHYILPPDWRIFAHIEGEYLGDFA